jgi:hypothetical protein
LALTPRHDDKGDQEKHDSQDDSIVFAAPMEMASSRRRCALVRWVSVRAMV